MASPPSPPRNFFPVSDCTWAELSPTAPGFINTTPVKRGRKWQGIKYERKAQDLFAQRYGEQYARSQWIRFKADGSERIRWCQPDGLLFVPQRNALVVVEFKYQHTEMAWWQMFYLYIPVVSRLFAEQRFSIRGCEVVRWYDPDVRTSQKPTLCAKVEDVMPGQFGVHIFNP